MSTWNNHDFRSFSSLWVYDALMWAVDGSQDDKDGEVGHW